MKTPDALTPKYEYLERLGRGAQGETFRALASDGSEVAIKALAVADVESWKELELFEREAKVLGGLDILGVPKLLEVVGDPVDDTEFYLVQELVRGDSLRKVLDTGLRFDTEAAVEIVLGVLRILAQLHALAPPVVHRDVKPSNIMVAEDVDGGVALIDFGAVTAPSTQGRGGSTVAGTFGYMAPEQLRSRATPASDLYATGAVLAELLTGLEPSEMEHSGLRLDFRQHAQVSSALALALDRLLEPDPDQRVQRAGEAIELLEQALGEGGQVPALVEDSGELIPRANSLEDLVAVGQAGSDAIVAALPPAPRKMPKPYRNAVLKKYAVYLALAPLVPVAGAAGSLILGMGGMEIAMMCILFPILLFFTLFNGTRRLRRLTRRGEVRVAAMLGTRRSDQGTIVEYEHVDPTGERYLGRTCIGAADLLLEPGDSVHILVSPGKPQESMVFPLPVPAMIAAITADES